MRLKDMYKCGRKITHKCKWDPYSRLIIVSHDYSRFSPLSALTSSLNDVSITWKYFRRQKCFNEDQIFVYGDLNIDGKIIPWRKRYNIELFLDSIDIITYFYYSGHGFPGGKIDIPSFIVMKEFDYSIIDCCYSHQWNTTKTLLGSTCENNVLASSNHKVSKFTIDLLRYILNPDFNIEDFRNWMKENNYTFVTECQESFIKDFIGN
jgi:hypothetical protein